MNQPLTLFWRVIVGKICRVPIAALVSNTVTIKEHVKLRLYRWLLPIVDRVVAVANVQKDGLVAELRIRPTHVIVIYNGIDVDKFGRDRDRRKGMEEVGLPPDRNLVGIVARLVRLKAIDVFLEAAKSIAALRPNVDFVVVGSGPQMAPPHVCLRNCH